MLPTTDPDRPTLVGSRGAVSSSHWLASSCGMAILGRGGNAFDAAVAAAFVLQVVEPHNNGPGGDVSLLLARGDSDGVEVVCGQGPAPQAATIAQFDGLGVSLIPGTGLLPACVPGAVDAWLRVLEEHGTMELDDVLGYAIAYAETGYPVTVEMREAISTVENRFRHHWPSSAEVYLPNNRLPAIGTLLTNRTLAATFRRLLGITGKTREARVRAARDRWYRGFVAEEIEGFAFGSEVMDETGNRYRGLIAADDLARFEAASETPSSYHYRDYVVYKTPAWGQGPVFLQQLSLLDGYDLRSLGMLSTDYVHLVTECAKLAFADREAWYGDPDFVDVPLAGLLAEDYVHGRRRLIGNTASLDLRPGAPGGRPPRLPERMPEPGEHAPAPSGPPLGPKNGDTCLVATADRDGNVLAAAPSGGWLHGSPVIPRLGFCLGTRAQMFWLEDGFPDSLAPGKRPRTTLSPTIAFGDKRRLAFGTPGGDQQDQWSLQFFLGVADFGFHLNQSIDVPVFHTLHFPNSFYPRDRHPGLIAVEGRVHESVVAGLRERGHTVNVGKPWDFSRTCAASYDEAPGTVSAGFSMRAIQAHAAAW